MPTPIPPPLASSDWTFRITQMDTEQVELPWSSADGWPSWQPGRTFAVVEMGPATTEARRMLPMRDLIGKGFVLHDHQHLILQVFDGFPLKVRTQVWPVMEVAS